jgi:hypothetical protein
VVIYDTRSCGTCLYSAPNVAAVEHQIDVAVGQWHATWLRMVLDNYSYASGANGAFVQYKSILNDPQYLANLKAIAAYVGTKPGVYIYMDFNTDQYSDAWQCPTAGTNQELALLATTLASYPWVMYGVSNEPLANDDGSRNVDAWNSMNSAVEAIRDAENAVGAQHHLVGVQGLGGWARYLDYYITHPIQAGGGENVVYDCHSYGTQADFPAWWTTAAPTLPVIIGEFGYDPPYMSMTDVSNFLSTAQAYQVPYVAWSLHPNCQNPLINTDNAHFWCNADYTITPADGWGSFYHDYLNSLPNP